MSAFVKRIINGPQMHYIVALALNVFSFRANVWTKQEDGLKAAGKLPNAMAETADW